MKFQLKALAVAAVLVAALPAQAAIQPGETGNGSLVLSVLDRSGISALFDLGKVYSDFNVTGTSFINSGVSAEGTNFSWDLTTGNYATAWSNFLAVASLPNSIYSVIAADNTGTGAGLRGYVASFAGPSSGIYTSQAIGTGLSAYANYINDQSNTTLTTFQNHTLVADGSSVAISGSAYAGSPLFNNNKINGVGPTVFGAVGADLGVIQVVSAASTLAAANQTIFGNGAKFNLSTTGLLTYSTNAPVVAVPEADSWAMMLLGLSFMGFVARRKQV